MYNYKYDVDTYADKCQLMYFLFVRFVFHDLFEHIISAVSKMSIIAN